MSTRHAPLRQDRQALLAGDSGGQALQDHHRPAPPSGGVEGLSGESRAEPAETPDLTALVHEVEWLRRRLLTQPVIEQAKGVLMGFHGVDADTAFAVLVRWSQDSNTKLHVVAAGLIAATSQPSGQPQAELRRFLEELATPSPPAGVST